MPRRRPRACIKLSLTCSFVSSSCVLASCHARAARNANATQHNANRLILFLFACLQTALALQVSATPSTITTFSKMVSSMLSRLCNDNGFLDPLAVCRSFFFLFFVFFCVTYRNRPRTNSPARKRTRRILSCHRLRPGCSSMDFRLSFAGRSLEAQLLFKVGMISCFVHTP